MKVNFVKMIKSLFELCAFKVCSLVLQRSYINCMDIPVNIKLYLKSICKNVWMNIKCSADGFNYSQVDLDNLSKQDFLKLINSDSKVINKQIVITRFFYKQVNTFLCRKCFSEIVLCEGDFDIMNAGFEFVNDILYQEALQSVILNKHNWCDKCILKPLFMFLDVHERAYYVPLSIYCDKINCMEYLQRNKNNSQFTT